MRKLKIYTLLLTAAILITTVTACTSQTTPKKRTNHIEKTTESGTYNATVVVRDNDGKQKTRICKYCRRSTGDISLHQRNFFFKPQ